MKLGDYIVLVLATILSIIAAMDNIDVNGFEGYSFTFGFILGGFILYAAIGFILLFAFRYIREHFKREESK